MTVPEISMPRVRQLCALVLALTLTGCINSTTLIKVKPDGSGTIEQSLLMNTATLKTLTGGLEVQGQAKPSTPFSQAEFEKMAQALGPGVRLVSTTPVTEGGFEGAKAIFAFDDIKAVRVQQDPSVPAPAGATPSSKSAPVTFGFTRQGSSSVLTVTVDDSGISKPAPAPDKPAAAMDPAMLGMMKQVLRGFKVGIDLEVDGKIVKTNADYVNGSRITLLELELDGLFADEAKLRELSSKLSGASLAEIRPYLKDVKGVKINQPAITVEYR
jgi:hypothetical protein